MKYLLILTTVFAMTLLTGCETLHQYDQQIYNASSQGMTFHFTGTGVADYGDSIRVEAGEQVVILQFEKFGAQPEGLACGISNSAITVTVDNGMELTKDITSEDSWDSEVSGKRTVTQVCTFTVNEEDLQ